MVETVNENTPVEEQQKDVELEDTKARPNLKMKSKRTKRNRNPNLGARFHF